MVTSAEGLFALYEAGIIVLLLAVNIYLFYVYFKTRSYADGLKLRLREKHRCYLSGNRDLLTGLLNRRGLDERYSRILTRLKRKMISSITVVAIDLKDFKKVNDKYGHPNGDEVLRIIAECLRKCTRDIDVVARVGGDEFTIVCVNTKPEDIEKLITRVNKMLSEYQFSFGKVLTRLIYGIVQSESATTSNYDELYVLADANLLENRNKLGPRSRG